MALKRNERDALGGKSRVYKFPRGAGGRRRRYVRTGRERRSISAPSPSPVTDAHSAANRSHPGKSVLACARLSNERKRVLFNEPLIRGLCDSAGRNLS